MRSIAAPTDYYNSRLSAPAAENPPRPRPSYDDHCTLAQHLGGRPCHRPWCYRHGQRVRHRIACNLFFNLSGREGALTYTLHFGRMSYPSQVGRARSFLLRRLRDNLDADHIVTLQFSNLVPHLHLTVAPRRTIPPLCPTRRGGQVRRWWKEALAAAEVERPAVLRVGVRRVDPEKWQGHLNYIFRAWYKLEPCELPPATIQPYKFWTCSPGLKTWRSSYRRPGRESNEYPRGESP
jgi:hypothetical protein